MRTASTPIQLRWQWLVTALIREIHVASRGAYGYRRMQVELSMVMGVGPQLRRACCRAWRVLLAGGRPAQSPRNDAAGDLSIRKVPA